MVRRAVTYWSLDQGVGDRQRRNYTFIGAPGEIRIPNHLAENDWVKIAFQTIWECLLWVVFCLSQLYHLTGSS